MHDAILLSIQWTSRFMHIKPEDVLRLGSVELDELSTLTRISESPTVQCCSSMCEDIIALDVKAKLSGERADFYAKQKQELALIINALSRNIVVIDSYRELTQPAADTLVAVRASERAGVAQVGTLQIDTQHFTPFVQLHIAEGVVQLATGKHELTLGLREPTCRKCKCSATHEYEQTVFFRVRSDLSPADAVRFNDPTYDPKTQTFVCAACFTDADATELRGKIG